MEAGGKAGGRLGMENNTVVFFQDDLGDYGKQRDPGRKDPAAFSASRSIFRCFFFFFFDLLFSSAG